ncbi:MAG: sulfatase-like hydrolase/transferase [Thermoleophilaceae bacterium]|nr:sulfatase-like hydrolase/transferase [Thermoleophilaceae bacterium]
MNLLLIVTDQERAPMHWPEGFARSRLKTRERLLQNGVSFEKAICNTAMCSPSRATFLTGVMPARHGVVDTLTSNGPVSAGERELSPDIPNIASMLGAAGYDVQYRGKWHLSKDADGSTDVSAEDLARYGFNGWVAPDAGEDTQPENFGGGRADHDARYIREAIDYLEQRSQKGDQRPFCLVVSLVNPHDVLAYPRDWSEDYTEADIAGEVELPPSHDEDLSANLKPTAHAKMGPLIDMAAGAFENDAEQLAYVNFYANLTVRIDEQLASLIDRFYDQDGSPTELGKDTLIVRFADHGELGLSHGGLRQKAFNVYEETIRVPLIFSNPGLAPDGGCASDAPASLIDIIPTVASILGVEPLADVEGVDLSPMIQDPEAAAVQQDVYFTFDDLHASVGMVEELLPGVPGNIRCVREPRYKFARYCNLPGSAPDEFEMYDLESDPDELENLAHESHPRYADPGVAAERERLAARLAQLEEQRAA